MRSNVIRMADSFEKNLDDLMYDEDFYSQTIDEEPFVKEEQELVEEDSSTPGREAFLVCDECDNRWEDYFNDDEDNMDMYCPMCGSSKITIM